MGREGSSALAGGMALLISWRVLQTLGLPIRAPPKTASSYLQLKMQLMCDISAVLVGDSMCRCFQRIVSCECFRSEGFGTVETATNLALKPELQIVQTQKKKKGTSRLVQRNAVAFPYSWTITSTGATMQFAASIEAILSSMSLTIQTSVNLYR